MNAEDHTFLADLGREIATQDNRATAHPVFLVLETETIYGIDTSNLTPSGYLLRKVGDHEGVEVEDVNARALALDMEAIPFLRRRRVVPGAVSLTRRGIEEYLSINAHNLSEPVVYVASMFRVPEMQRLRDVLKRIGEQWLGADGEGGPPCES